MVVRLSTKLTIEELPALGDHLEELADLLTEVVDDGASIGFLLPMERTEARNYWKNVIQPDVVLYVAKIENKIAGSIQLHLCTKPNGTHRAEIAKLMTHPAYRRNGIARTLMNLAMERARQEERSLLILDTRAGDPSNLLYQSLGFLEAGRIPNFAQSETGELHPTVIYYKNI